MPFAALFANPLVRKIAMYAAIAAAVLLAVRWYTNSVAEKAKREGEVDGQKKQLELDEAVWKPKLDALDKALSSVDEQNKAAAAGRAAIRNDLARGVNSISAQLGEIKPKVDAIAPKDYDRRIKELLVELR
jgi:hypothetical protein